MLWPEVAFSGKICDGASNFEDAIVTTRREAKFGDGIFHDLFAFGREHAVLAQMTRTHLSIGVDAFVEEAAKLDVACGYDSHTDGFRRFGRAVVGELLVGNRRN